MSNRLQILADVIVDDTQVDQAINKGVGTKEEAVKSAKTIAANQVSNEVNELSRLLSAIQNNEKPGYYKKLDEEGQGRVAALETQLAEMRGAGREELHAVAKEVSGMSETLGVRASKALSAQINKIGEMIISIDDVRIDAQALLRARAKGIRALSGMEATVRMRVDNAELKAARAEMEEVDRASKAAVRRSASSKAQVRRIDAENVQAVERGPKMDGRGVLTHSEAVARTNSAAVTKARAAVLERGKSVLEGKDLSAEQVRTRAAALIEQERKTGQPVYSGEQKRILISAADGRPRDAFELQRRNDRFDAARGVNGDFKWPEEYQPATRVIAQRNAQEKIDGISRRVVEASASIVERAERQKRAGKTVREKITTDSLKPEQLVGKWAPKINYSEVDQSNPITLDQAPSGSRFSPKQYGVKYTRDDAGKVQSADVTPAAKRKMADDAARVAVSGKANSVSYQSGLTALQLTKWRPGSRAATAQMMLNPERIADVMISGQGTLDKRRPTHGDDYFGEDLVKAMGLTTQYGEKGAEYPVRVGSDLEKLLDQNQKNLRLLKGQSGYTLRNAGSDRKNPHAIQKLFQRARGFQGDDQPNAKGETDALMLDGKRVGVADLYRMIYGGEKDGKFVAGGMSAYDLYPTMSFGESQAAIEEGRLHGMDDVVYTTQRKNELRVFETDPDVARSMGDERDKTARIEHAQNQLLGVRYQQGQRIDAVMGQQSADQMRQTLLDAPSNLAPTNEAEQAEQRRHRQNYVLGADTRSSVRQDIRGLTYFDELLAGTLNAEQVREDVNTRGQRELTLSNGGKIKASDAAELLAKKPKLFSKVQRRELEQTESLRRYADSGVITDGVREAFAEKLERELYTDALPVLERRDGSKTSVLANLPIPAAAAGQLAEQRQSLLDPQTYGALKQYEATGIADPRATSYLATYKKEHRDNLGNVDLGGKLKLDDVMPPIFRPTINSIGDMLEASEDFVNEQGTRNIPGKVSPELLDARAASAQNARETLIPEMIQAHQERLNEVFTATKDIRNVKGEMVSSVAGNLAAGDTEGNSVIQTTPRDYFERDIDQYDSISELPKIYGLTSKEAFDLTPDRVLQNAYAQQGNRYLDNIRSEMAQPSSVPEMRRYIEQAESWRARGKKDTDNDIDRIVEKDQEPAEIAKFLERDTKTIINENTGSAERSEEVKKSRAEQDADRALASSLKGGDDGLERGDVENLLLGMPVSEGIDPDLEKHWDGKDRESEVSRVSRVVEDDERGGKKSSEVFERYTDGKGARRTPQQIRALRERLLKAGPGGQSAEAWKQTMFGLEQAEVFRREDRTAKSGPMPARVTAKERAALIPGAALGGLTSEEEFLRDRAAIEKSEALAFLQKNDPRNLEIAFNENLPSDARRIASDELRNKLDDRRRRLYGSDENKWKSRGYETWRNDVATAMSDSYKARANRIEQTVVHPRGAGTSDLDAVVEAVKPEFDPAAELVGQGRTPEAKPVKEKKPRESRAKVKYDSSDYIDYASDFFEDAPELPTVAERPRATARRKTGSGKTLRVGTKKQRIEAEDALSAHEAEAEKIRLAQEDASRKAEADDKAAWDKFEEAGEAIRGGGELPDNSVSDEVLALRVKDAEAQVGQNKPINSFRGEHAFLSNMQASPVMLDGKLYPSVEHAFQAAKTHTGREAFQSGTAADAKKRGRKVKLRPDWEQGKVGIMAGLLAQKFAPGTEMGERLSSTGQALLIEGNTWGDAYWGVDNKTGEGQNQLGQLLMAQRASAQAEQAAKARAHEQRLKDEKAEAAKLPVTPQETIDKARAHEQRLKEEKDKAAQPPVTPPERSERAKAHEARIKAEREAAEKKAADDKAELDRRQKEQAAKNTREREAAKPKAFNPAEFIIKNGLDKTSALDSYARSETPDLSGIESIDAILAERDAGKNDPALDQNQVALETAARELRKQQLEVKQPTLGERLAAEARKQVDLAQSVPSYDSKLEASRQTAPTPKPASRKVKVRRQADEKILQLQDAPTDEFKDGLIRAEYGQAGFDALSDQERADLRNYYSNDTARNAVLGYRVRVDDSPEGMGRFSAELERLGYTAQSSPFEGVHSIPGVGRGGRAPVRMDREESKQWLKARYEQMSGELTLEQSESLKRYKGSSYDKINASARVADGSDQVADIQGAIGRHPLDRDVRTYRGMNAQSPASLELMELYEQGKLKPGAVLPTSGFASTSTHYDTARSFMGMARGGVMLSNDVRRGTLADSLEPKGTGESEVLIAQGQQFRVKSAEMIDGNLHVETEVHNPEDGPQRTRRGWAASEGGRTPRRIKGRFAPRPAMSQEDKLDAINKAGALFNKPQVDPELRARRVARLAEVREQRRADEEYEDLKQSSESDGSVLEQSERDKARGRVEKPAKPKKSKKSKDNSRGQEPVDSYDDARNSAIDDAKRFAEEQQRIAEEAAQQAKAKARQEQERVAEYIVRNELNKPPEERTKRRADLKLVEYDMGGGVAAAGLLPPDSDAELARKLKAIEQAGALFRPGKKPSNMAKITGALSRSDLSNFTPSKTPDFTITPEMDEALTDEAIKQINKVLPTRLQVGNSGTKKTPNRTNYNGPVPPNSGWSGGPTPPGGNGPVPPSGFNPWNGSGYNGGGPIWDKTVPNRKKKPGERAPKPAGDGLYDPVNAKVYQNSWIKDGKFNSDAIFSDADLKQEMNNAIRDTLNQNAIRASVVGEKLQEDMDAADNAAARARGADTSIAQEKRIESNSAASLRVAAVERGAALSGMSVEDFRRGGSVNGSISRETAMTKILGEKLSSGMINDDALIKEVVKYADLMTQFPQEAGKYAKLGQEVMREHWIRTLGMMEDRSGIAQDEVRQGKADAGVKMSSAERTALDGQNRTNERDAQRLLLSGQLGMTPAQLTDTSKGRSIEGLIQEASGNNLSGLAGMTDETVAQFGEIAKNMQSVGEQFGYQSSEFQGASQDAASRRPEILSDNAAALARTTEAEDRQRRYKTEIDRQMASQDSIDRMAASRAAGMSDPAATAAERRRVADRVALGNERTGMIKAGLVNMGAFLGGSLLEQGLTYGVTQLQDGVSAQRSLQRAAEVQGAMLGSDSGKPGWYPAVGVKDGQYNNAQMMVGKYSDKLGATQTETADLIGSLSDGGTKSQSEVKQTLEDLSRAAQNTGLTLKDLTAGMDALGEINFDPDEAAAFLGKFGGLKDLAIPDIALAAQKVAANGNNSLLGAEDREKLLLGTAKAGDAFTGFSTNSYVAGKQAETLIEQGGKAKQEAPELKGSTEIGKWIAGFVQIQQLMARVKTFITELAKALAPVVAVWLVLVNTLLAVVTSGLRVGNSFGWLGTVAGGIVGLTTVVLALNAALRALHFPNIAGAIARVTGLTGLATAATARFGVAQAAAGAAARAGMGGATLATVRLVPALGAARLGAQAFVAALLGPIGWVTLAIGGLIATAGLAVTFFNKKKASEAAKVKTDKEFKTLVDVENIDKLPNYTPSGGVSDKLRDMKNGQSLFSGGTSAATQLARASLGDFDAGLGLMGTDQAGLDAQLKNFASNGSPEQKKLALDVKAAKERIEGVRLVNANAKQAGEEAFDAELIGKYRQYEGSPEALKAALTGNVTPGMDEQFEADAFRASRQAARESRDKGYREMGINSVEDLAVTNMPEYTAVKIQDKADADKQLSLELAALDARKQSAEQQARMNDGKIQQLEGQKSANQAAQDELRTMISAEQVLATRGIATGNLADLQSRLNELTLQQKQTEEQILQAKLDQITAVERFLELEQQLGLKEDQGLAFSLAGEEAGTQAGRQSGGRAGALLDSIIIQLLDKNNPMSQRVGAKEEAEKLAELKPLAAQLDTLKNQQAQELETANLKFADGSNGVSAADNEKAVAAINSKYAGLIQGVQAKITGAVGDGTSIQDLLSTIMTGGTNEFAAISGNMTQEYGKTPFALKQQQAGAKGAYASGIHDGLDFGLAEGTALKTSQTGMLEFLKDKGDGWGSRSQVTMADGQKLIWSHQNTKMMESLMASLGMDYGAAKQVQAGNQIGVVGQTGNVTGPHAHISGINANGKNIDPTYLLAGGGAAAGKQTFGQAFARAISDPAYSTSGGVKATKAAQTVTYDTQTGTLRMSNSVREAQAAAGQAAAEDTEGFGAPDTWTERKVKIDNNLKSELAKISAGLAATLAELGRELNRPGASVADREETQGKIDVARANAQTQRTKVIGSSRDASYSNSVDATIGKIERDVKLKDGKETPETLNAKIGMINAAIKDAETVVDPRYGGTMKDQSISDYDRLIKQRKAFLAELARKKKDKKSKLPELNRRIETIYGTATGTVVAEASVGKAILDEVNNDDSLSEQDRISLGIRDGKLIKGSKLDSAIDLADTKNKFKQTDTQFDMDRDLAKIQAGDNEFSLDRSGLAKRAQSEYDAASKLFDSKKSRFPSMEAFEKAKAAALSGLLQNVKSTSDDVRAWNTTIKNSQREISALAVNFGGVDQTGTNARRVEDQIEKDRKLYGKDSPEMAELNRTLQVAKVYDSLDLKARTTRSDLDTDEDLNTESKYKIDYAGRAARTKREYEEAVDQFNDPKNLARLGNLSSKQLEAYRQKATAGQRQNMVTEQERLEARQELIRKTDADTAKLGSKFGQRDRTPELTNDVVSRMISIKKDFGEESRQYQAISAKLPIAKIFDGLDERARNSKTELDRDDFRNAESRYNIDFEGRVKDAKAGLAQAEADFDKPENLVNFVGYTAKELDDARLDATAGQRSLVERTTTDLAGWKDKQFNIDEGIKTLREQSGLESLSSPRVKNIESMIRSLEQDTKNVASTDPRFKELAELKVVAQKMDTADDNLRLGRVAGGLAGINDGNKSFSLETAATMAYIESMKTVALTNKDVRDSIDSMNIALATQAEEMRRAARVMKTEYGRAARDLKLTDDRIAESGKGSLNTSELFVQEQGFTLRQANEAVESFDDERSNRLDEFKRGKVDIAGMIDYLGDADERTVRFKNASTFSTDAAGKSIQTIEDDDVRNELIEAVFDLGDLQKRGFLEGGVSTAKVTIGKNTVDALSNMAPQQGFESLLQAAMDTNSRRSPEEIISEAIANVSGVLNFAQTDENAKAGVATPQGQRALSDAKSFQQQLLNLSDKPEALKGLGELRVTQRELANNAANMSRVAGDGDAAKTERARLDQEGNAIKARMNGLAEVLRGLIPQEVLNNLLAGGIFTEDNAAKLRAEAEAKGKAVKAALVSQAESSYKRTARNSLSLEDTDQYYDTLRTDLGERTGRAYDAVRGDKLDSIKGTYGELAKKFGVSITDQASVEELVSKAGNEGSQLGLDLKDLQALPTAAKIAGMDLLALGRSAGITTEKFNEIAGLRNEANLLNDEQADARASVSEKVNSMAQNVRDAISESAGTRLTRSLNERDYAGAGRNAALVTGQMENNLLASVNARNKSNLGRDALPGLLKSLETSPEYSSQVAEIYSSRREQAERINSAATMNSYNDSIDSFDRQTARARPAVSQSYGREYDLKMLQQKLAMQQSVDTSTLDTGSQEKILGDVRATMREIENVTNAMQDKWRTFWNGLASDMMGAVKDGLAKTVVNMLDSLFKIETQAMKELRSTQDASKISQQGDFNEAATQRENAEMYDAQAIAADKAGRFQEAIDFRALAKGARQKADEFDSAGRAKGTDQVINQKKYDSTEGEKDANIWMAAVDSMKTAFVSRITGEMLDESLGKLFDIVGAKLTKTEDPQLMAAEKISAAGTQLGEVVTAVPASLQSAFEKVTTAQSAVADKMNSAANTMLEAASRMNSGSAVTDVISAIPGSTAGTDTASEGMPGFGVSYPKKGETPPAPAPGFGVSYPKKDLTGQEVKASPYGQSQVDKYGYGAQPSEPSQPSQPSQPKEANQPKPLITSDFGRSVGSSAVNIVSGAINIPKTGNEIVDYGVGYAKAGITTGLASWVAGGAAGGLAGAGGAVWAALTNPVTAAIAVVGAGIMLVNKNLSNQKQAREFEAKNFYGGKATGAHDYGIGKTQRWAQVGGDRAGNGTSIKHVNITVTDPLSSPGAQLEIGRKISQQSRVETLRKGVNG